MDISETVEVKWHEKLISETLYNEIKCVLSVIKSNYNEKKKVFFLSGKGGYPPTVDKKGGVGATTLSHLSSRYC